MRGALKGTQKASQLEAPYFLTMLTYAHYFVSQNRQNA